MCGIAGAAALGTAQPITEQRLQHAVNTLVHRGPDDLGMAIHDGVAMGMRRLAIIDVEGGAQPVYTEQRDVWCVFNGEIYNFQNIRKDLQARGHVFSSQSDSEVIVHAYQAYGDAFADMLTGMFAIALHDRKNKRLLLVRDQLGIKPFYYSVTPSALVFGSEIKAVLAFGLNQRALDSNSLAEFLTWEYIPAPNTLFQGIQKLEPGRMLVCDLERGETRQREYWSLRDQCRSAPLSIDDWEQAIDEALTRSTQAHMLSDVPLGAFLSGGVDSSLIAAHMGDGAQTFSIGFDDPSYNELAWSRKVASHLGMSHQTEVMTPDVLELTEKLMQFMDDPIGDFSIFPTFLVSALARQSVTVALSGDGGDELFGGYETYLAQRLARKSYDHIPSFLRARIIAPLFAKLPPTQQKKGLINKLRRFSEGGALDARLGHARWRCFLSPANAGKLFTPRFRQTLTQDPFQHILRLQEDAAHMHPLQASRYVDSKSYLPDNILLKVDRMSMATSLEARVPFLTPEVAALAFSMPHPLVINRGQSKYALKRVAERYVPREAVYRAKEGFSIPIKQWLNASLQPLVQRLLDADQLKRDGIFEPSFVARLIKEHADNKENHSHILWSLLVFHMWQRLWLN